MITLQRLYWKYYRKFHHDSRVMLLPRRLNKIMRDPSIKKVFILTFCNSESQLYGTTLIFNSIRLGFPNASVIVIDNASIPKARKVIKQLALKQKCDFFQLEYQIPHYTYLEDLIMNQPLAGTVINLDPDIMLWKNCENWSFNMILAGNLIPSYVGELSKCKTQPRIHTSFYWIEDIIKLRNKIKEISNKYFEFEPFHPIMFKYKNKWVRFDTGGNLFSAIKESCYLFTSKEKNAFDHIFGGTHLNLYIKGIKNKIVKKQLEESHRLAEIDPTQLKGIWRTQLKYLRKSYD